MLKIGDFSKLAQVSVKALRHYDRLSLIKPAWVDRYTGYRYYMLDQLPRLNRILALKDLGFSLEQIGRLLKDNLSAAELRGMMRLKHGELARQLQAEQARLARIEARLRQIEQEGALPPYEVVLKSAPPQQVIGVREVLPGYHAIGRLHDELNAYLQSRKVPPESAYPALTIYYDREHQERGADVEAAAPLNQPLPGAPRISVHQLPGAETMACTIHQGAYEQLNSSYRHLLGWVEANGYRVTAPNRDVYLQGPDPDLDPADYVTELQFPVEKKPVSVYVKQIKEKPEMEHKIESRPAFMVVGMLYHGKNENNEIPQLWQAFNPRMGEVKHISNDQECFGVCGDLEEDGETFKYMACWEVSSPTDIPEGMASWEIPAQTYAVFPCTLTTIHQAYEHAHQTWLPQSGYQRAAGPDFELYNESFDPQSADSVLYVYIPIVK